MNEREGLLEGRQLGNRRISAGVEMVLRQLIQDYGRAHTKDSEDDIIDLVSRVVASEQDRVLKAIEGYDVHVNQPGVTKEDADEIIAHARKFMVRGVRGMFNIATDRNERGD